MLTSIGAVAEAALPDGRGYELVSPVDKNGGAIAFPETLFGGGVFQASSSGDAVTYSSATSFGDAQGSPGGSQYLSRRQEGGWTTESLTPTQLSGAYPSSPGSGVPYRLFSNDLGWGLLSNGKRCRGAATDCPVPNPPIPGTDAPDGYRNYYLRDNSSGTYEAILSAADLSPSTLSAEDFELQFVGATPDLSHVIVSTCAALTANSSEIAGSGGECDPSKQNLYERTGSQLSVLNIRPGDGAATPGASLAAPAGAISADGSRVYWSDGTALYLRQGSQTETIAAAGTFQVASGDGSIAYYTEAEHLYRHVVSGGTADLTPAGGVKGVLGASADGSYVYYLAASGVLLWHAGTTTAVAKAASASSIPPATGTARVTPDGRHLAFLSNSPLTGYGSKGLNELFVYTAPEGSSTGALVCASCSPEGRAPVGPASIPGAVANGAAVKVYKPRVLSSAGTRVFFESLDPLVLSDTNNQRDVYEWEANGTGSCSSSLGCVALISSGRGSDVATFLDASASGDDVFFITDGSLVPGDPSAADVYDAKVGGGFPVPEPPIPCIGDACQPILGQPDDPALATTVPRAGGNPPLTVTDTAKKKHRAKRHHRKKKHRKKAHR
jgi:hypothetical protein